MIWWKAAGCVCVAFAAALAFSSYASLLSRRLDALARAARFASFVGEQIEYYETPFPEIARKFAERENVCDFSPGEDVTSNTLASIEADLADGLEAEDASRFASFFDGVGAGFADTETRLCDEAKAYFKDRLAELGEEYTKKKRARGAIALFAVFSVFVLVW